MDRIVLRLDKYGHYCRLSVQILLDSHFAILYLLGGPKGFSNAGLQLSDVERFLQDLVSI